MSVEENEAIVRRVVEEFWNKRDMEVADELFATNYVNHDPVMGELEGLEGFKQWATQGLTGFPDLQITIEDMVAEGDKVAVRLTATGTHTGEFMGVPPTGVHVTNTRIHIFRFAGGKIVESWANHASSE